MLRKPTHLKRNALTLWFILRDKRTPLAAKLIAAGAVGYVFSPVNFIPNFVPVLGLLDDLIVVSVAVAIALKITPADVVSDCRAQADKTEETPRSGWGAMIVAVLWFLLTCVCGLWAVGSLWSAAQPG